MNTKSISTPPIIHLDPGMLCGLGARVETRWINGGTLGPVDANNNLSTYHNDSYKMIDRHVSRLIVGTNWLISTYSQYSFQISCEMFEGLRGLPGAITSRIAHQYIGFYSGRGYTVILVKPRAAGSLHLPKHGGTGLIKCAYPDNLNRIRPTYGEPLPDETPVPLLPNDGRNKDGNPNNIRVHERATYDGAAFAVTDPDRLTNVAA